MTDDDPLRELHRKWENPPADTVGKLPRAGIQLDYLGHAAVTRALLDCDPTWEWEPAAWNEDGNPMIVHKGNRLVMWIRLTVFGVTRLGVGTCADNKGDPEKELIGDALRNAAMRFGVGLSLWAKEEWHDLDAVEPVVDPVDEDNEREQAPVGTPDTGSTPSQADAVTLSNKRREVRALRATLDDVDKARLIKWMKNNKRWPVDSLTIEQLDIVIAYVKAMNEPVEPAEYRHQVWPVTKEGWAKRQQANPHPPDDVPERQLEDEPVDG